MNTTFPFGFQLPLAFYLTIYVLTLVVHVVLMAYVLGGSLWLTWASLFPGKEKTPRTMQPVARLLRDWMPFALSGAITAGVAPLLFVQILYQQQFYTANLLLGWRWMVVIPVLIVVFYLLYVVKSRAIASWALPLRVLLACGVATCFLFVAFCWTANHLLSLDQSQWPTVFQSGNAVTSAITLALRLATWVCGTLPVMSLLGLWQLRGMRSRTAKWDAEEALVGTSPTEWDYRFSQENRRLMILSVAGTLSAFIFATLYYSQLDQKVRHSLTGSAGFVWLMVLVTSAVAVILLSLSRRKKSVQELSTLLGLTCAQLIQLVAAASLREVIRLTQADLTAVTQNAADAFQIGGFAVFLIFAVMNAGLITWCIVLVKQK
ncbi:MAG: hypothetical protein JNM43_05020 [Planctomycetaceae bacterium]|nr:hypothetical protein [Planctomycetaceae bacterium]